MCHRVTVERDRDRDRHRDCDRDRDLVLQVATAAFSAVRKLEDSTTSWFVLIFN